jgi:hypothetical protein
MGAADQAEICGERETQPLPQILSVVRAQLSELTEIQDSPASATSQ